MMDFPIAVPLTNMGCGHPGTGTSCRKTNHAGRTADTPCKPEADKLSAQIPKVVYPLPPKPAEPEREKPPPESTEYDPTGDMYSLGLYDMGGNVWQWCEDWYDAQAQYRVLRGASWNYSGSVNLLASYRDKNTPDNRNDNIGFRCVVAVESSR